jgi:hypothetical protein
MLSPNCQGSGGGAHEINSNFARSIQAALA